FTFKAYHTRFTPDYVARPTIGYQRDNFGRGFFGGTAISLSDLLGNHTLVFAGAVNGRLSEAQVLPAYINQTPRLNWAAGFLLDPQGSIIDFTDLQTISNPSISYASPSLSLVHDNALFRYVGPFAGSRFRFQVMPSLGDWQFVGGLADWRRYFFARPFTLALR